MTVYFLCIRIIALRIQHHTLADAINHLGKYAFNPTYLRYSAGLKPTAWLQDRVHQSNNFKNYNPAKNKQKSPEFRFMALKKDYSEFRAILKY